MARAIDLVADTLASGHKLLLFGNGGSAADAQHLAAELVGRFLKERRPLPAVALTTDTSALTAIANDYGYDEVFARQVRALGTKGDVALAISTSGKSPSILRAVAACREMGIATIGLTGGTGGDLARAADLALIVSALRLANPVAHFEAHGVGLSDGAMFGAAKGTHVRINFGCTRATLLEALRRMKAAVAAAKK